jgi:uncharacterized damage-inducible protein DinB
MQQPLTSYLTQQIETNYRANHWYGFGLLVSLGKLTDAQWHQPFGHRTVADIVGHLIAWRQFAVARMEDRTDFGIELHSTTTDWPDCSGRSPVDLLNELEASQTALLKSLERLTDGELDLHFPKGYTYSKGNLALGVMQHDIYHTGQINLLVKLLG